MVKLLENDHFIIETSMNLSTVKSTGQTIIIQCFLKSSVGSEEVDLENMAESVFNLAGAETC